MAAAGVVSAETPKGDVILFGAAASEEAMPPCRARPRHRPGGAAALPAHGRFLSPVAAGPRGRLALRRYSLATAKGRCDVVPSAHEKDAYLREQIDDEELRKLRKNYPHSKWADLADWDMLDNKVCGDWQGSTKCPEKEAEMYEKYAQEHPDSPRAPEALYNAVYRQGALNDIYTLTGTTKKPARPRREP